MQTSQNGINFIKQFESFSATPYLCPSKFWTIGWGHVILNYESFTSIDIAQAESLLRKDLRISEDCVNDSVVMPLTQNQFDALVSFVFNVGCEAFNNSTLLRLLNVGKYTDAAEQFLRWNKSKGKVLNGLTRRRQAERQLFLLDLQ